MEEERKREKKRAAVHVCGCNVNVYVCRQLATPSSVSGGRGLACCVGEVLVDLKLGGAWLVYIQDESGLCSFRGEAQDL